MTYVPYEQAPHYEVAREANRRIEAARLASHGFADADRATWEAMLALPFARIGGVLNGRPGFLLDSLTVDILKGRVGPGDRGKVGYSVGQRQNWCFSGLLAWELVVAMLPGTEPDQRAKAGPGSEVRNAMRMTFEACDLGGAQTIRALCVFVALQDPASRTLWRDACFFALDALPGKRT